MEGKGEHISFLLRYLREIRDQIEARVLSWLKEIGFQLPTSG